MNYQYCCVSPKSLRELEFIIDNAREITYETFIKHVNKEDLADLKQDLGYGRHGLTLKNDWAVSYHKSKLPNSKPVYFLCHSCIEYVFY